MSRTERYRMLLQSVQSVHTYVTADSRLCTCLVQYNTLFLSVPKDVFTQFCTRVLSQLSRLSPYC